MILLVDFASDMPIMVIGTPTIIELQIFVHGTAIYIDKWSPDS